MKYMLCTSLLFVFGLTAMKTNAQTQGPDPSVQSGHFEFTRVVGGITNHINVNYSLSPAPFVASLQVALNTPDPTFFSVDVVDGTGGVLLHWVPSTTDNTYSHSFDISALPPGSYFVHVNDSGPTLLSSIPFTK